MDETIRGESNLGQRLGKLPKSESSFLVFKGKSIPVIARITIGSSSSPTAARTRSASSSAGHSASVSWSCRPDDGSGP